MKKINAQQMVLTGMETHLCECGCGNYFMRSTKGNPQRYVNKSHKKRAQRAREALARTDTRVRMAPLGWLYLRTRSQDTAEALWRNLNPDEQTVLRVLCETGLHPEALETALARLFTKRKPKH